MSNNSIENIVYNANLKKKKNKSEKHERNMMQLTQFP